MDRHIKPGLCFPREITATGVHVWSLELHFAPRIRVHRVRQNILIANIYKLNSWFFFKLWFQNTPHSCGWRFSLQLKLLFFAYRCLCCCLSLAYVNYFQFLHTECDFKGRQYEVGSYFRNGCNTCTCVDGGVLKCTNKQCKPGETIYE